MNQEVFHMPLLPFIQNTHTHTHTHARARAHTRAMYRSTHISSAIYR